MCCKTKTMNYKRLKSSSELQSWEIVICGFVTTSDPRTQFHHCWVCPDICTKELHFPQWGTMVVKREILCSLWNYTTPETLLQLHDLYWFFAHAYNFSLNLIDVHINCLAALDHLSIHNRLHHCDDLCDHWRKEKKQESWANLRHVLELWYHIYFNDKEE